MRGELSRTSEEHQSAFDSHQENHRQALEILDNQLKDEILQLGNKHDQGIIGVLHTA